MKEIRYFYCPDISVSNELPKEEFEHAVKVLRLHMAGQDTHRRCSHKKYQPHRMACRESH